MIRGGGWVVEGFWVPGPEGHVSPGGGFQSPAVPRPAPHPRRTTSCNLLRALLSRCQRPISLDFTPVCKFFPRHREVPSPSLSLRGLGVTPQIRVCTTLSPPTPSGFRTAGRQPWQTTLPDRSEFVMAETRVQDVVNQSQSAGDRSPSDASLTTSTIDSITAGDGSVSRSGSVDVAPKENGIHLHAPLKMDDLDDASARSDTDTSRADGSVAGDKSTEQRTFKKYMPKPVSFAKYSVPKVIAATAAAAKGTDKVTMTPNSSTSSVNQIGRPRLVAKTTSSLQSQARPFKSATPDPMQVWNKNRVTPQPSTKHLTDEELKQQYGIHLTSRIQEDGEGKEAKWADIDDDEDDWAPETIEWNDGTKSTLTPADVASQAAQKTDSQPKPPDKSKSPAPAKTVSPQFASSVGPNATVLKLGASAERQQAQKTTTLQTRAASDKPSLTNKTAPAPAPPKSPWASLPPVDKLSPVAINPQPTMPPPGQNAAGSSYGRSPTLSGPSPAKEISADDFNRSWRDTPGQPRELYMPNSGRYEAVPEGRRRMSKNEQNHRAPAVLQRPSFSDPHAPEPSAAFQTNRTSTDFARRRASSTLSGGSGQFGRRMSIKSGDATTPVFAAAAPSTEAEPAIRPPPQDEAPPPVSHQTTYQARGASDQMLAGSRQAEVEAQAALMRERIESARKRKLEEEARAEAEKQERIRLKLASLGPDPKLAKKSEEPPPAVENVSEAKKATERPQPSSTSAATTTLNTSPPKPPQPLASGEPQQYGMMKVHPLNTVKKMGPPSRHPEPLPRPAFPAKSEALPKESHPQESASGPSPSAHGSRIVPEVRQSGQEPPVGPEPSPKYHKPSSVSTESQSRSGWGEPRHDHRSHQGANMWGLPNNKALGNGTFDQSLAGYAPQDLSRASTSQGWLNGRTPNPGRSPQSQYANHALPNDRSYLHQPLASPDPGPLAADSEVDSLFPTTNPAPIAPPNSQPHQQQQQQQQTQPHIHQPQPRVNGFPAHVQSAGISAWNNFHTVASQQERAENERIQREYMARRDEEARTGVRQGPQYTFNETWKQVQVSEGSGNQVGLRQTSNITQLQPNVSASNAFGAVGSLTNAASANGQQSGRGSRFFPQPIGAPAQQERRAVTYSHPEPPRTPSPPPAEEVASFHPAFDGDSARPVVHLPPARAVVKLPPALPPTPPSPVQPDVAPEPILEAKQPMTWAARVSLPPPPAPAPAPAPSPLRTVSQPIVNNPSWQERFNGLLGRTPAKSKGAEQMLSVSSSTREPLDVLQHVHIPSASVSLPEGVVVIVEEDDGFVTSKNVENEDDLFEDREPGSLPTIHFPKEMFKFDEWSAPPSNEQPRAVESMSATPFMTSNFFEPRSSNTKPQFTLVKFPGDPKAVKRDFPAKSAPSTSGTRGPRFGGSSAASGGRHFKSRGGTRSRQASAKVH